ncbi:hypothetical protein MAP00_004000 [Monascus purpureus]|nr:hypothetical protein MAP00_004000 [Monascus purpureus]
MKDLAPLTRSISELHYARYDDVRKLISAESLNKSEADMIKEYDSRKIHPQAIFLGMDESHKGEGLTWKVYSGIPYFALDVTPKGSDEQQANAKDLISRMEAQGLTFFKSRMLASLPGDQAAIYAQARALIDWNTRNTYCGTCGSTTLSVHGGTKRACPPTDAALVAEGKAAERPLCNTRTSISNLSFPRTDPTVIAVVLSADGQRILLGRSKRFPPNWYSALAGFMEPGESIEDAVRREVWEESGVTVSRVIIHSSQPWPYPANLMIGAIGQVSDPAYEKICLEHDAELEDARWFPMAEAEEALKLGATLLDGSPPPEYKEGGLKLPPPTAIANQLIRAAVDIEHLLSEKHSKM